MKFLHSSLVKQVAADIVAAQDRHLLLGDAESAARLAAAEARLTRILTEQIACTISTPTPARAALVAAAAHRYVQFAREYADRQALQKNNNFLPG